MDENADLLGSVADQAGAVGAQAASKPTNQLDKDAQGEAAEEAMVARLMREYQSARDFDRDARIQYSRDRRYAAGLADPNWASDANLIGSFIDILVSFLYAQNPDPGVRPAAQVDEQPNQNASRFAETLELVIDKLWRDGNLKKVGKKWVRSALTVGPGWIKGTMLTQKVPAPQLEQSLNTLQDKVEAIKAKMQAIQEGEDANGNPADDMEVEKAELDLQIEGVKAKLLKKQRFGMMADFVRAEDIQVALNVSDLADYTEADWISTDIYVPKDTLNTRFEDLDEDQLKGVQTYYQRNQPTHDEAMESQLGDNMAAEGQFSKTQGGSTAVGGTQGKPLEFAKIIEFWDRRDFLVKTMVDGVKKFVVQPYPPPQASTRFYPFFYLALFPIDGKRHPQSLTWRLRKLQDEYSSARSNQRLSRERSVTGVIFNSAAIDPTDAKKITEANQQELIGVRTVADQPLANVFIAKPVGTYNPELYNTAPIRADMESISGVQEALQQNAQQGAIQPKTATEAQIEQQGFASRTGADRDTLEGALTEFAQYTAEVSTQECPVQWVQRVCGANAFWLGPNLGSPAQPPSPKFPTGVPAKPPSPGMDVEDVLTMTEVSISAGTTGKPNFAADKANWATILPLLEKSLMQIRQMQLADPGLADALIHVLRETLHRMDDRLDIDDFIPQGVPSPPPPVPPQLKVNVNLTGALPPDQEAMLMGAEAELHHIPMPGAPGAAPGAAPPGAAPPGAAALPIPAHIPGTAVPMPPLSMKKPAAPAAPPSK
jgi:hypothetical protein